MGNTDLTEKTSYVFNYVLPSCVENRLINTRKDQKSNQLIITEFIPKSDATYEIIVENVCLPEDLSKTRIIGQPLCIGCQGKYYVFQFITETSIYIKYFSVDLEKRAVKMFQDCTFYFTKSITTVAPIECRISSDLKLILLRLPHKVKRPSAFSNILMVKDLESCTLEKSRLQDRKQTCVQFHPQFPETLFVVHVNNISSRCILQKYESRNLEMVATETHKIHTFDFQNTETDETSEEQLMSLCSTSIVFDRTGKTLYLVCLPAGLSFVSVHGFNTQTLELKCSFKTDILIPHKANLLVPKKAQDPSPFFSTEISACNSLLCLYILIGQPSYSKKCLAKLKMPVVINLKQQVRVKILQSFTGKDLEKVLDQLPKKLRAYLLFSDEK